MSRKISRFTTMLPQPLTTYQFKMSIPECGISSELVEAADLPVDPWGESAVAFRGVKVSFPTRIENGGDWECTIPESIFLIAWSELGSLYYRQFYNSATEQYKGKSGMKQSSTMTVTGSRKINGYYDSSAKVRVKPRKIYIESDIGINDTSILMSAITNYKQVSMIGKDIWNWAFRKGKGSKIISDAKDLRGPATQIANAEGVMGIASILRAIGFCRLRICMEGVYLKKITPSSYNAAGATENVKMKALFHYNRAYPLLITRNDEGGTGINAIMEDAAQIGANVFKENL